MMATKRSRSRRMLRILESIAKDETVPSFERITAIAMFSWIDAGKPVKPVTISNLLKKAQEAVPSVLKPLQNKNTETASEEERRQAALNIVRRQKGE